MEKKEIIKNIIQSFFAEDIPTVIPRELSIPLHTGAVIPVIGSRRSGKTFLLFETMQRLLAEGVNKDLIVYINFENEKIADLQAQDLDLILQAYRELYPNNKLAEVYFFFDEIQNVPLWQKFVRRIHESISKNIFITGSNSKLLSSEIATELRGRTLTYEVFPLSFREFLRFKGIEVSINDLYAASKKATIVNALDEYLLYGGFPEVVGRQTILKDKTLQEYLNVMITNDLVARYRISSYESISFFIRQLINSNAKEFSVNKIYNSFRSINLPVSNNTLYDYLGYVQNIYLAFVVSRYVSSDRLKEQGSKKTYTIDSGLYNAVNTKNFDDKARLFENMIFLDLYRTSKEIYFYKDEYYECDFIMCDRGKVKDVIQVSYSIADTETRRREFNGLVRACKELHLNNGKIITYEGDESVVEEDGIKVEIISALRYLLENKTN